MVMSPRFPPKPPGAPGERAPAARGADYASKDAVVDAIGTLGRAIDHRLVKLEQGQQELREGQRSLEKGQKALETRMDRVEQRLDGVERRLDGVETRLDRMEDRQTSMEHRLTNLEVGQDTIIRVMNDNHAELNRKIELILATISPQPR